MSNDEDQESENVDETGTHIQAVHVVCQLGERRPVRQKGRV
jgi:hypothetical protein